MVEIEATRFCLRETVPTEAGTGILLVAVTMIIARIPMTLVSYLIKQGLVTPILICRMIKILQMLVILIRLHNSKIKMVLEINDDHETLLASEQVASSVAK